MENLYYVAPSDDIFTEVQLQAIMLWRTYNDDHGYASNKINKVESLKNVGDNIMFIVAMFDMTNQAKLAAKLSDDARHAIRERLIAGGASPDHLVF